MGTTSVLRESASLTASTLAAGELPPSSSISGSATPLSTLTRALSSSSWRSPDWRRSLTIGDAVYQILALDRQHYNRAKKDVLVEKKVSDFNEIYENYLAPWIVKENGRVQAASGDDRVAEFLDERVVMKTQFSSYPSIFEIRKNDRLLTELESLTRNTEAVISLAFRSIGALLPTVQAQDYYNEIVNTLLALWEVNI